MMNRDPVPAFHNVDRTHSAPPRNPAALYKSIAFTAPPPSPPATSGLHPILHQFHSELRDNVHMVLYATLFSPILSRRSPRRCRWERWDLAARRPRAPLAGRRKTPTRSPSGRLSTWPGPPTGPRCKTETRAPRTFWAAVTQAHRKRGEGGDGGILVRCVLARHDSLHLTPGDPADEYLQS